MFCIENVEKFIKDTPGIFKFYSEEELKELMERAHRLSKDGIFMEDVTAETLFGIELASKFLLNVETDPNHIDIALKSIGEKHGFKEVVPGIMINTGSGFEVSISHPDPVFIITNSSNTNIVAYDGRDLLIFSDKEEAENFMAKTNEDQANYTIEKYSWRDLVDKCGETFSNAIVDYTGEPGFFAHVPLRNDI